MRVQHLKHAHTANVMPCQCIVVYETLNDTLSLLQLLALILCLCSYMLLPYECCFMSFLLPSMFSIATIVVHSLLSLPTYTFLSFPPLPSPPLCRMSPCRTWPQGWPEQAARRTSQN